jgi:acyl-CoA hydrolase
MHALTLRHSSFPSRAVSTAVAAAFIAFLTAFGAYAATATGAALKPAFDMLQDIVGGYGMQLLVLVGFVAAAFAVMAVNATGAILKFIGFVIFLAVGLGAALALSGAVI